MALTAAAAPQFWRSKPSLAFVGGASAVVVGFTSSVNVRLAVALVALPVLLAAALAAKERALILAMACLPLSVPVGEIFTVQIAGRELPIVAADFSFLMVVMVYIVVRPAKPPSALVKLVTVYLVWTLVSVSFAADLGVAVAAFKVALQAVVVFILAAATSSQAGAKQTPLVYIGVGASVMAATLGFQLLLGAAGESFDAAETAAIVKVGSDLEFARSNYVASLIVLGLVGGVVAWRHASRLAQLVVFITLPFSIAGIYLSGSKTQAITFLLLLVPGYLVAIGGRAEHSLAFRRAVGLLFVAPVAFWAVAPYIQVMFSKVSGVGIANYRTVVLRVDIWNQVLDQVVRSPVVGNGLQNLTWSGQYSMAHNTPLQVAGETGIPGLLLYSGLFALVLLRAADRTAALFLVSALLISGAAENTLRTREYDLVAWGLLGAVSFTASKRLSRSEPASIRS